MAWLESRDVLTTDLQRYVTIIFLLIIVRYHFSLYTPASASPPQKKQSNKKKRYVRRLSKARTCSSRKVTQRFLFSFLHSYTITLW